MSDPIVDVVSMPGEIKVVVAPSDTPVVVTVTTEQAHDQAVPIAAHEVDFYPPHPPRSDSVEYNATHKLLVHTLDTPCRICGVRQSSLTDLALNIYNSTALETHHYPIQREYTDGVDWRKVARDFTQVIDQSSLIKFIDSPANMWILCSHCHRDEKDGIHHAVVGDWVIHRYLLYGYILTDDIKNAVKDLAIDQAIVDANIPENERI